jgi:hypothetical protein
MPMTHTTSDYNTVTGTSQELPLPMIAGFQYKLVSTVDAYVKVGLTTATTAAAADNNHIAYAGVPLYLAARGLEKYVAIIRIGSTDGVCTLSRLEPGSIS